MSIILVHHHIFVLRRIQFHQSHFVHTHSKFKLNISFFFGLLLLYSYIITMFVYRHIFHSNNEADICLTPTQTLRWSVGILIFKSSVTSLLDSNSNSISHNPPTMSIQHGKKDSQSYFLHKVHMAVDQMNKLWLTCTNVFVDWHQFSPKEACVRNDGDSEIHLSANVNSDVAIWLRMFH